MARLTYMISTLKQAHHYARYQDLIMDQLFLIKYPRNNLFELNFAVHALFLHSNVWCIARVSIIGIPIVNPEEHDVLDQCAALSPSRPCVTGLLQLA